MLSKCKECKWRSRDRCLGYGMSIEAMEKGTLVMLVGSRGIVNLEAKDCRKDKEPYMQMQLRWFDSINQPSNLISGKALKM